jgi:hypothetical protein
MKYEFGSIWMPLYGGQQYHLHSILFYIEPKTDENYILFFDRDAAK